MKLPVSKSRDVVVQEVGDELLIYDLVTNRAFALNKTSAIVYRACDGETGFDDLKVDYAFTDDLIYLALDELKRNNLITGYETGRHFKGLTRREAVRRVGLASMIALPVISSLVAPIAAQSLSACNGLITVCDVFTGAQDPCCDTSTNPVMFGICMRSTVPFPGSMGLIISECIPI